MRRLRRHLELSLRMHRDDPQRGAVAVVTALCLVVMLGFAAIAVDVGALYQERAELQSAADAGALAVAQDCANDLPCTPEATLVEARKYATANVKDGFVSVAAPEIAGNTVKVSTTTLEADGTGSLALTFAPILGIDSATVGASSTAAWGTPAKGPAMLPLAFAPCNFDSTGGLQVIAMHGTTGGTACSSKGASGQNLPGGFGWLEHPAGTCKAVVDVAGNAPMNSDSGVSLPSGCGTVLNSLKSTTGTTILLPVYDDAVGSGAGGYYSIRGWAAFKVFGWNFSGGDPGSDASTYNNTYGGLTCKGSCRGFIGQFIGYASLSNEFTTTTDPTADLGASVVTLTG